MSLALSKGTRERSIFGRTFDDEIIDQPSIRQRVLFSKPLIIDRLIVVGSLSKLPERMLRRFPIISCHGLGDLYGYRCWEDRDAPALPMSYDD